MRIWGVKLPPKRPDDEHVGVGRVDEIEVYPAVARHLFVQALGDTLHDGLDRGSGDGKAVKFLEKLFMRKHHVTALVLGVRGFDDAERSACALIYADCGIVQNRLRSGSRTKDLALEIAYAEGCYYAGLGTWTVLSSCSSSGLCQPSTSIAKRSASRGPHEPGS
jgi:hypothetical protein